MQFMQRHGPIIRRLTVSSYWKCASDDELDFYEGLRVLEQLVIGEMKRVGPPCKASRIPSCIPKLKLLDISSSEELRDTTVIPYCFELFERAMDLESFAPCYIFYESFGPATEVEDVEHRIVSAPKYLQHFIESLERRKVGVGKGDKLLKVMNLNEIGFYYEGYMFNNYSRWLEFVRTILNYPSNIMLHGISSGMLKYLRTEPELCRRFAHRIVSFSQLKWSGNHLDTPNLEIIWKVDRSNARNGHFNLYRVLFHPEWSKLQEIHTGVAGISTVRTISSSIFIQLANCLVN
jgi:hypothetical protein